VDLVAIMVAEYDPAITSRAGIRPGRAVPRRRREQSGTC
jgi:hypothetical protein